jgi:hypothetical protein
MNKKNVFGAIRRHPGRALAVCVPLAVVGVFAGTTMASAQPEAMLAVSPSAASAAPAPYVMNFDSGTAPKTRIVKNKRDIPIKEPRNIDGCDHDYGTGNQCVPWQIPASSPQAACAWLRANGFGPLKVYGTNRQNLPENSAGYVCATGT